MKIIFVCSLDISKTLFYHGSMTLKEYMAKHKLDRNAMAYKMGVTSQAIWLWMNNKQLPSRRSLAKIKKATDNRVTSKDFPLEF